MRETALTMVDEILVTGRQDNIQAPRWARAFRKELRVVQYAKLRRMRSLPLLTVVRVHDAETLLEDTPFIELLVKLNKATRPPSVLLLEFKRPAKPSPRLVVSYAKVVGAFPPAVNLELAFGAEHAEKALVEALAKVAARAAQAPTEQQDPLRSVRQVVQATADLRNRAGRLAADKVGKALGVPVAEMARLLGTSRQALSKSPDAESRQLALAPFERVLRLRAVLTPNEFLSWLRMPNRELDGASPLDWIEDGKVEVVANLVDDMLTGTPS